MKPTGLNHCPRGSTTQPGCSARIPTPIIKRSPRTSIWGMEIADDQSHVSRNDQVLDKHSCFIWGRGGGGAEQASISVQCSR